MNGTGPELETVSPAAQWKALSTGMAKQILRDPTSLFFSVAFPLALATFFVVLAQFAWGQGTYSLALSGSEGQAEALAEAIGPNSTVAAVSAADLREDYDALAELRPDTETLALTVRSNRASVADAVQRALPSTPWNGWSVVAATPSGSPPFNPMTFILPGAIAFALMTLAVTGTAGALAALRASGTLRLLATTPVRKTVVLLSLVPIRAALALTLLAALGTAAVHFDLLEPLASLRMLVTAAFGLAMMLSLGYLLGGLFSNVELTNAAAALLTPVVLIGTGVLFPLEFVSETAASIAIWTPPAMFADALRHDVLHAQTQHPIWLSWTVMLATTVLLTAVAARTFKWDTKESL